MEKKLSKQFIESVPLGGRAACKAAGTQHSYNKWLHRSSTQQNLRLNGSLQGVDTNEREKELLSHQKHCQTTCNTKHDYN